MRNCFDEGHDTADNKDKAAVSRREGVIQGQLISRTIP
jgi:hypothetical protein